MLLAAHWAAFFFWDACGFHRVPAAHFLRGRKSRHWRSSSFFRALPAGAFFVGAKKDVKSPFFELGRPGLTAKS